MTYYCFLKTIILKIKINFYPKKIKNRKLKIKKKWEAQKKLSSMKCKKFSEN